MPELRETTKHLTTPEFTGDIFSVLCQSRSPAKSDRGVVILWTDGWMCGKCDIVPG